MALSLSRPGQINGAGDDQALFLKMFSGEVLTAFHLANKITPLGQVRTLSSGKSASFPVTGRARASWHTVGDSVIDDEAADDGGGAVNYLNNIGHNEKLIYADEPIVAPTLVADIDAMRQHFDVRSIYAQELGQALAKKADINALGTLYKAAVASTANITDVANGTNTGTGAAASIPFTGSVYGPEEFEAFCYLAQAALDNLAVPEAGRFVVIRPDLFYSLFGSGSRAMNRDYGGTGTPQTVTLHQIAGLSIVKSETFGTMTGNNSALTDPGSRNGAYRDVDWRTIGAIVGHRSAFGTLKMADVTIKHDYITERLSDLMIALYVMGHGVLRPESALLGTTTNLTLA